MIGFPLLAVSFFMNVVAIIFVLCCAVLVLIILIQKGRGGGLSAAFGGGMASGILGSKTGDFLTWVTIVAVSIFLALAVVLAKFYRPSAPTGTYDVKQQAQQTSPTGPPQPPATKETKSAAGNANSRAETNQPGG
jgi:preprotein translocase subunit SecG